MSVYFYENGSLWRQSDCIDGEATVFWLDPDSAVRLLPLLAEDPATRALADQLRAALIQQQNDAMESAA